MSRPFAESSSTVADICVIVPKDDEFVAHLAVFGVGSEIDDLPTLRGERYPYAQIDIGELRVALVCIRDQGNTASALATSHVLNSLHPTNVYLSGTALGNPRRSDLGSLRISDHIDHANQWVEGSNGRLPRFDHYEPPSSTRKDLGSFISDHRDGRRFSNLITPFLQAMQPDNWEDLLRKINPSPEMTHMVTDNTLVRDIDDAGGASKATLWQHEERASAYDMECGGFGREMQHESGLAWAVVRSVSDFGFDKSNAESGMRTASALLAATFIREFIANGISKSHPRALRPAQTTSPKLSPQQHYSQHSASDYFANRLSDEFGFSLPVSLLSRELSLGDVAIHLSAQGLDSDEANRLLEVLRVEYFESKYLEYDYSLDIRGYFGDYWYQEIREMLAWYGYESLVGRSLLDVGCGNGLEIGPLMELCSPSEVTGVDLSRQMLARANERHPAVTTIACSADALRGIESESIDAYLSLRTYMSRFFDVPAALREAYRVLKPGGLLLISIANGYLDYSADGAPQVVTGLKEVGGSSFVSADRPFELLSRYHRQIRSLGFERLHVLSKLTDVYIGALKPGALDARKAAGLG